MPPPRIKSTVQFACACCLLWVPALAANDSETLLEAARKGKRDQVEALVAKGAGLETRDKDGRTPLMLAAQYGRASTVVHSTS